MHYPASFLRRHTPNVQSWILMSSMSILALCSPLALLALSLGLLHPTRLVLPHLSVIFEFHFVACGFARLSDIHMLVSSPEKNPHDPVMLGTGARPQRVYGTAKHDDVTRQVRFTEPVHNVPVVDSLDRRNAWDADGWARMPSSMKDRLIRNLCIWIPSSHCTGSGGMERLGHRLRTFVNTKLMTPLPVRRSVHCSDISASSFKFVNAFTDDARPSHFHDDMTDRWPMWLWESVQQQLPEAADLDEAKRLAYSNITDDIKNFYKSSGPEVKVAPCHMHKGAACDLYCGKFSMYVGDNASAQGGLHVHMAGIPCDDMTAWGQKAGSAGKTSVIHSAWSAERAYRQEDVIVGECTLFWSPDATSEQLPGHDSFSVELSGKQVGDCLVRARKVATFLRTETVNPTVFIIFFDKT